MEMTVAQDPVAELTENCSPRPEMDPPPFGREIEGSLPDEAEAGDVFCVDLDFWSLAPEADDGILPGCER